MEKNNQNNQEVFTMSKAEADEIRNKFQQQEERLQNYVNENKNLKKYKKQVDDENSAKGQLKTAAKIAATATAGVIGGFILNEAMNSKSGKAGTSNNSDVSTLVDNIFKLF